MIKKHSLLFCFTASTFLPPAFANGDCWEFLINANEVLHKKIDADTQLKKFAQDEVEDTAKALPLPPTKGFSLARLLEMDTRELGKIDRGVWLRLSPEDRAIADRLVQVQDGILSVGPAYEQFMNATHARTGRWLDSLETEQKLKTWINKRMEDIVLGLSKTRITELELKNLSMRFIEVVNDIESIREARPIDMLVSRMEIETAAKEVVPEAPQRTGGSILSAVLSAEEPTATEASPSSSIGGPRLILSPFSIVSDPAYLILNDALRPASLFDFEPIYTTENSENNLSTLGVTWDMTLAPPTFQEVKD